MRRNWPWIMIAVVAALLVAGCTPNRNTAATRKYQAFITRYNIYYNGDTHFRETLKDMEEKYEDDYSRQLFMHPVQAKDREMVPQPSGNFDRTIEKAQKAIQLRSIKKKPAKKSGRRSDPAYKEWMARDEYNPFLHNAWMMLGNGQFYNGDFLGAASTYFYISRHFGWLPQTVTEAQIRQALAYLSMDWTFEADVILKRIKDTQLTTPALRELYNFAQADSRLRQEKYAEAVPFLAAAAKAASGPQKTRLTFLLGQVYSRLGEKQLAFQAFKKAGSASSAPYRTKFNARIKQSEVFTGTDITPEVKALRRMTRYGRNKEYLDQIYYAIGNLYLSRRDTTHAIENYILANEKSTRSGIDKALNQLTLGGLYFDRRQYELAQPCYAEAVPQLPKTHPGYRDLQRRSDVLDELAVYSQNVNLQDSLLRLADMDSIGRLKVIDKIIADLKKKEKEQAEAARREEHAANAAANAAALGSKDNTNTFTINTDNSWYFYNTAAKNAGKTEFQKRWGSRKLEDNWRRRNKASFSMDDFMASEENADDEAKEDLPDEEVQDDEAARAEKEAAEKAADPHNREYYLAQIPMTAEDRATSHEVIQDGLYNMGVILKDKLEDFPAAEAQFNRLLADYPDNIFRLDTYNNLYLMYMRQNLVPRAEEYRTLIVTEFPDSPQGVAMKDPQYLQRLREMDNRQQELYDRTYQAYLDNDNAAVHALYKEMSEKYPLSKIMPKFMFLEALAYVTEKQPEQFAATLREMLEKYPETDLTPPASAWLKGIAQGRELRSQSAGNMRGMIWDIRLGSDSIAATDSTDDPGKSFALDPDSPQYLVLTYDTDRVSTNELLYNLARHNFRSFVVRDFDLEPMTFGRLGMILIKGFDDMRQLDHYRCVMADSDFRLPAGVRPIAISRHNFEVLMTRGLTFDDYFRFLEQQNYTDAQEGLITPQEIEPLPEPEPETIEPENPEPTLAPDKPAEKPAAAPAPTPITTPKPSAPSSPYLPGSEGDDDPLLL